MKRNIGAFVLLIMVPMVLFSQDGRLSAGDAQLIRSLAQNDSDSSLSLLADRRLIRNLIPGNQLRGKTLQSDSGQTTDLEQIVTALTEDSKKLEQELSRGGRALLGGPTVTEVVAETEDSYIVARSVRATVVDPNALAGVSTGFREYLAQKGSPPPRFQTLSAADQKKIQDYLTSQNRIWPANHPLRTAAAQSPDAVLRALHEGLGDFEMTDVVTFSKRPLALVNGAPQHPAFSDGLPDFRNTRQLSNSALDMRLLPVLAVPALPEITVVETQPPIPPQYPTQRIGGTSRVSANFLMGFSRGRQWEWERRWNFGVGFFRLSMGASYGYGFRLPFRVDINTTPSLIDVADVSDQPVDVNVLVSVHPVDADERFYRDIGIPAAKIFSGNEFVLEASFYYGMKLYAFGVDWIHIRRTEHEFSQSTNFQPPLGARRSNFVFPIPANITGTRLGGRYLSGELQFGADIGLEGRIDLTAKLINNAGAVRTENWVFQNEEDKRLAYTLPVISTAVGRSRTVPYQVQLSEPKYSVSASLAPSLRGVVRVDVPGYSRSFSTGWLTLNAFRMNVGSADFGPHAGTRRSFVSEVAQKTFTRLDPAAVQSGQENLNGRFSLQERRSGRFVQPRGEGRILTAASISGAQNLSRFDIRVVGREGDNNIVTLSSPMNLKFVRAGVGGQSALAAVSDDGAGSWQRFVVYRVEGGIALKSQQSNRFVIAETVGNNAFELRATGTRINQAAVFLIAPQE